MPLQESLTDYAHDVVDDEFVRIGRGEPIEQQSQHLTRIWESYPKVQPITKAEDDFYQASIRELDNLSSSRKERIDASQSEIPDELWVLLIGGGVIIMIFTFLFGTPDLVLHAIAVALTAALMAFVTYLTFALEHPFVGTLSVKSDAYIHVLEIWSQPTSK